MGLCQSQNYLLNSYLCKLVPNQNSCQLLRKKQWLLALHYKHISLKKVAHQEFVVGHLTKGSQEFEGFTQFWMPITQTHSQIFCWSQYDFQVSADMY